jgi:hypothetical protein
MNRVSEGVCVEDNVVWNNSNGRHLRHYSVGIQLGLVSGCPEVLTFGAWYKQDFTEAQGSLRFQHQTLARNTQTINKMMTMIGTHSAAGSVLPRTT